MNSKANIVMEIPLGDSLYTYVNEYHRNGLDKIMSRHFVAYQFKSNNGHWVLELSGDEQNVSRATSEVSGFFHNLISRVGEEDVLDLPGNADLEALKRLADQRIARPMQVLILPNAGTGFRLIGPRDRLTQTKERLLALAVELGLPVNANQSHRTEFLTTFGTKVSIFQGNLVLQQTEAIVNPANERLQHYGGAAKAIMDAAGPTLHQECQAFIRDYGPLRVSEVMHTTSGKLYPSIKHVLHAVGPRSDRYPDPSVQRRLLEATFYNCLLYAEEILNASSIAVPAIGSGIYGISKDLVAEAAFSGLRQFETQLPHRKLLTVNFVNIDDMSTDAFLEVFRQQMSRSTRTTTEGQNGGPIGAMAPQSSLANAEDGTTKAHARLEEPGHPQLSTAFNASLNIDDGAHARCKPNENQSQSDADGAVHTAPDSPGAQAAALVQPSVNSEAVSKGDETASGRQAAQKPNTEELCVICMEAMMNPKELPCGHKFCAECIRDSFEKCQPKCPSCGRLFGVMRGNQPPGTMKVSTISNSLPGYHRYQTLVVDYQIPSGIQNDAHPHPGQPYFATHRQAYLPNNREGKEVCDLLRKAFDAGLIFTVGQSISNGLDDQVIWNDIHHKTKFNGAYGYPDPDYLSRVKEELKAKGIVPSPAGYYCSVI